MTVAEKGHSLPLSLVLVSAGLHILLPLSTDIYLAAAKGLASEFNVGVAGVQRTMISFSVGLGLAHLFIGGLADHYGRRRVALIGLSIYLAATLACCLATSLDLLVFGRFIQGLAAATGPILLRAIVRDSVEPKNAPKAFSSIGSIAGWGPVIAPLIGAVAAAFGGWRASIFMLAIYSVVLIAAVWRWQSETLPPEYRSPERLGRPFSTLRTVLASRDFLIGSASVSFGYGALYAWLSTGAFLMFDRFHYSERETALSYGLLSIGFLMGNVLCARVVNRINPGTLLAIAAGCAVIGLIACHLLFEAMVPSVPLLIAVMAPMYLAWGFCQPISMAVAMRPFAAIAGQASAWFGLFQQLGSAAIALTATALGAGTNTMLVMAAAMTVPALAGLVLRGQPR